MIDDYTNATASNAAVRGGNGTMGTGRTRRLGALACTMLLAPVMAVAPAMAAAKPYRVFLSMSYVGNDWQAEAENMVKAMAASSGLRDEVDLSVQVSGPSAQRQIQQLNAMVQAGARAIVVYPISPTALDPVIQSACRRGVLVIAYDAEVQAPCAYNVHIDQREAGRVTAAWLAKRLGGKGNVVMMTGVPGTSVDTGRTDAALAVFKQDPGIHVIAEGVGLWSQAVARQELAKIVATHPWSTIDGLWMQVGCFTATAMEGEAGIPAGARKPCAGAPSRGHRVPRLRAGPPGEGARDPYVPMGLASISYGSPPYSGALALKLAVRKLDGGTLPHDTILPLPLVDDGSVRLCRTGSWKEMNAGCNAFQPSVVTNPGWFADIYSKDTPELGLEAALHAKPES